MKNEQAGATAPKRNIRWIIAAALALLLVAAVNGFLGPFLAMAAIGTLLVGLLALVRGHLQPLSITSRKAATGVLLGGAYLLVLGGAVLINSAEQAPVIAASGDPCEVMGSINTQDNEPYYCTPSSAGELAWASEEDFTAHQESELEDFETQAIQEAEAAGQEIEEDLAAAEERAEAAETKVAEYQAQVEDYEEELTAAQEAAEEAEARQSQPAPAGDAPAPEPQTDNTGPTAPFENCTAAREAGAAPVHRGEPGYGSHLDRDGDGIGCE